ncbi:hypothetical protein QBC47DRAFT_163089 [Echria macrotheca]|uniref:Uncharacterized protein n=1 Tax=Echria macrotheca TaxID=438768 RepID=A0AAJ0FBU2_9PEZI|nr:hypothetical protein QBC47DRAFT_163089 [Echria macrotheca]
MFFWWLPRCYQQGQLSPPSSRATRAPTQWDYLTKIGPRRPRHSGRRQEPESFRCQQSRRVRMMLAAILRQKLKSNIVPSQARSTTILRGGIVNGLRRCRSISEENLVDSSQKSGRILNSDLQLCPPGSSASGSLQQTIPFREGASCKNAQCGKSKATAIQPSRFRQALGLKWRPMIFVNSRCPCPSVRDHFSAVAGLVARQAGQACLASRKTWYGPLTNGPRMVAVGCPRFLITSENQDPKGRLQDPGFAGRVSASLHTLSSLAPRLQLLVGVDSHPAVATLSPTLLFRQVWVFWKTPLHPALSAASTRVCPSPDECLFGPSVSFGLLRCHRRLSNRRAFPHTEPVVGGMSNPRCGVSIARLDRDGLVFTRIIADRLHNKLTSAPSVVSLIFHSSIHVSVWPRRGVGSVRHPTSHHDSIFARPAVRCRIASPILDE